MPAVMLLESQCHLSSLLLSLPEALMDDHAFSFLGKRKMGWPSCPFVIRWQLSKSELVGILVQLPSCVPLFVTPGR